MWRVTPESSPDLHRGRWGAPGSIFHPMLILPWLGPLFSALGLQQGRLPWHWLEEAWPLSRSPGCAVPRPPAVDWSVPAAPWACAAGPVFSPHLLLKVGRQLRVLPSTLLPHVCLGVRMSWEWPYLTDHRLYPRDGHGISCLNTIKQENPKSNLA